MQPTLLAQALTPRQAQHHRRGSHVSPPQRWRHVHAGVVVMCSTKGAAQPTQGQQIQQSWRCVNCWCRRDTFNDRHSSYAKEQRNRQRHWRCLNCWGKRTVQNNNHNNLKLRNQVFHNRNRRCADTVWQVQLDREANRHQTVNDQVPSHVDSPEREARQSSHPTQDRQVLFLRHRILKIPAMLWPTNRTFPS